MRPADENQYSTRPNLMSSGRRAGGDQNILEMLERDTGRGKRRGARSRLRWYGAGGALAAGLIGLLAWLAHDSPPPQEAQPIVVAEAAAPPERVKPDPADELMGLNELDEPPRPHHAAVIDEQSARQAKPITPVAMLTPSSRSPLADAAKGAVVQDDPTVRAYEKTMATATHEAPKSGPVRAVSEPAHARAPAKQLASSPRSQRKLAHNAPRARKAPAPAQPGHSAVDSDVALISAVIQHSATHGGGECADASCAAKTTAQP
ncbi:MAG: hypothetical protein ACXWC4_07885 [Telluria sp.]